MKIIVVCPGKLKDKWLKEGIDEYKKRLSRFATLEFIEVADCPDSVPMNEALKREGELILSHIKPGDIVKYPGGALTVRQGAEDLFI